MHRLFDEFAHRYDLHTPAAHYQHDHALVLELAREFAPRCRLLDIGCGTGVLVEKARSAGIDAVGIDSAAGMVRTATARVGTGLIELRRMQDLDSAADFDVITFLSWTLNYCANEEELSDVLRRCRRALKPGGVLVAQVAHAANATGELFEDREPGPGGAADDVVFLYRFARLGGAVPTLQADYVYGCRSANELLFESHVLNVADANLVATSASDLGFDVVRIVDSWRCDAFTSSLSPLLIARVGVHA